MKKGFTLIEILVVIGIIMVLIGVTVGGYSKMTKSAEKAKAQELVSNAATALTAYFQTEGCWPKRIQNGDGRLDEKQALVIARGYISMTTDSPNNPKAASKLMGLDRFGLVTPWAQARIKSLGTSASLESLVSGSSTIRDHILYYAVDLDGNGLIEGKELQNASDYEFIRATAAVWCCGKNGESEYVRSWTYGQTQK